MCLFLLAPKIEKVNDHICDITWECLQPMKGDPVIYSLQVMVGKDSEFKQVCSNIKFYRYIFVPFFHFYLFSLKDLTIFAFPIQNFCSIYIKFQRAQDSKSFILHLNRLSIRKVFTEFCARKSGHSTEQKVFVSMELTF